jgi:hypothetical protein
MSTQSTGADSGSASSSQSEYREFVVMRDAARPLSFAGVELARATRSSGPVVVVDGTTTIEAAIYRTRGGKFITTLTKATTSPTLRAIKMARELTAPFTSLADEPEAGGTTTQVAYRKAEVHDTFEAAMGWFKPGRLTDELRRQLGLDQPERID